MAHHHCGSCGSYHRSDQGAWIRSKKNHGRLLGLLFRFFAGGGGGEMVQKEVSDSNIVVAILLN